MAQLEKSFTGLEKSLSGEQQDFIDYFSEFLKKAPDFNLKTTADDDSLNTITKRIGLRNERNKRRFKIIN